ncbi:MAG: alpha/beta hydrolase [Verrucomicrobia bacterium]|nr:alpha/beta hydrolase [Verrucomicrobiota bacterium]
MNIALQNWAGLRPARQSRSSLWKSTTGRGPFLLALALALAAGAQEAPRSEFKVPDNVELLRDVQFGTGGGRALKLHILRPKSPPKEPMPGIVYVYGGAWRAGSREAGIRPLVRFAQRGYFCASIEYRLSQEAIFPAQIEDCKCALRFLRAKAKDYHLNPDRIGVWGPSAGGHLAALLGTSGGVPEFEGRGGWPDQSSRVQAVVDWFGPSDFLQMNKAGSTMNHDATNSPESQLIGVPIQENKAKAAWANPITYVSRDDPPFLIMHGDQDPLVPFNQSELLDAALKTAGVTVTFHPVKGAGHGGPGFAKPEVMKQVEEFFDTHLRAAGQSRK